MLYSHIIWTLHPLTDIGLFFSHIDLSLRRPRSFTLLYSLTLLSICRKPVLSSKRLPFSIAWTGRTTTVPCLLSLVPNNDRLQLLLCYNELRAWLIKWNFALTPTHPPPTLLCLCLSSLSLIFSIAALYPLSFSLGSQLSLVTAFQLSYIGRDNLPFLYMV